MRFNRLLKIFLLFILFLISIRVKAGIIPEIEYVIAIPLPHTHLFHVEIKISEITEPKIDLSMPVWSTGYYRVCDFAGQVSQFEVLNEKGEILPWEKIDKNTWRIRTCSSKTIKIKYVVYGRFPKGAESFVNARTGHILGSNLLMFIDGREDLPAFLKLKLPQGWKVSCGAIPIGTDSSRFRFASYHELIDTPMIIGKHSEYNFTVAGIPHIVAIEGTTDLDHMSFVKSTKKFVETAYRFFGGLPYKKYCFILFMTEHMSGGLEHSNSTTMGKTPWGYSEDKKNMESLLHIAAHEYFHLWNVKKIKSKSFIPYNYDHETTTGFLWFSEGVTEYYTYKLLLRAGLINQETLLQKYADLIMDLRSTPGRHHKSAFDSAFDTWHSVYPMSGENAINSRINYYTKGMIAGLIIDMEIMKRTSAAKTLDDVFLGMWKSYLESGTGFDTGMVQQLCEETAGGSFKQIFEDYVYGVKEVPFEEIWKVAGFKLVEDIEQIKRRQKGAYLGAVCRDREGKTVVNQVLRDTRAWMGGLDIDDEIIALDGLRIRSQKDLAFQLRLRKPGEEIPVLVCREGHIEHLSITMEEYPVPIYKIVEIKNPAVIQMKIRDKWLEN